MFSQVRTEDSRSTRIHFPSSFDTYLEISLNEAFKKTISPRKAAWMPPTQRLTHQTETQLKLCVMLFLLDHTLRLHDVSPSLPRPHQILQSLHRQRCAGTSVDYFSLSPSWKENGLKSIILHYLSFTFIASQMREGQDFSATHQNSHHTRDFKYTDISYFTGPPIITSRSPLFSLFMTL